MNATNTLTTQHLISYNGLLFVLKGKHEYAYAKQSKMRFFVYLGSRGRSVNFGQLREAMDYLIKEVAMAEKRKQWHNLIRSLSTREKIAHANFIYARFQPSGLGNYYNIYWSSWNSPTGRELVGGCSEQEWEQLSRELGKQSQYLSPTEDRASAR